MKKLIALALSAVMAISLAACGGAPTGSKNPDGSNPSGSNVEIPNPWVDCETMNDAAELAGFDFTLPDSLPEGFTGPAIQAMQDKMIQATYQKGEDEICIRKAPGSADISGDYNQYAESSTVQVGDAEVTMKGSNGQVALATWVNGDYTYSVGVYGGDGISSDTMSTLIVSVQ